MTTNFNDADCVIWQDNDGGRAASGYIGSARDCVTRAIAIASGLPYAEIYRELHLRNVAFSHGRSRKAKSMKRGQRSPRNGVPREVYEPYLYDLGFEWIAVMKIGSGVTMHLRADELPTGMIIARCSRHLVAVNEGTIQDTTDPSRDGTRAVYGYFRKKADALRRVERLGASASNNGLGGPTS